MVVIYMYEKDGFLVKAFVSGGKCYMKFSYETLAKKYHCENAFLAIELAKVIVDFYLGDTKQNE